MPHHLNRLVETVQMRGHNICLYAGLTKIIIKYSLLSGAQVNVILTVGGSEGPWLQDRQIKINW